MVLRRRARRAHARRRRSRVEVYLLTALRGIVLVLDAPARQALTFQMVGRDELPERGRAQLEPLQRRPRGRPRAGRRAGRRRRRRRLLRAQRGQLPGGARRAARDARERALPGRARRACRRRILRGTAEALALRPARAGRRCSRCWSCSLLSTFSFNFNVLLPVLAGTTLDSGRQRVRRDHRRASAPARSSARCSPPRWDGPAGGAARRARPGSALAQLLLAPTSASAGRRPAVVTGPASRCGRRAPTRPCSSRRPATCAAA